MFIIDCNGVCIDECSMSIDQINIGADDDVDAIFCAGKMDCRVGAFGRHQAESGLRRPADPRK